jgi:hypothetical protein
MTRKQLAVIAVILGIVVAVTIFHAGQYTYIRVFFGCDAPFEDFTSFSGLYYWVNGLVDGGLDAMLDLMAKVYS